MYSNILSEQECKIILKNTLSFKNVKIENYIIVPLTLSGFLGEHFKMKIEFVYKGQQQCLHYFIKQKPPIKETQNAMIGFINEANVFKKELFIFNTLISNKNTDWAPKFYFSKENKLFVLEDLTVKGYKTPMIASELCMNYCQVALRTLASFHCFGITFEHDKSIERGKKIKLTEEYPEDFKEVLFKLDDGSLGSKWFYIGMKCFRTFIDHHPNMNDITKESFKKLIDKKYLEILEHIRPSTKYLNTISHGDLWSYNIFFKCNNDIPEHCNLVDYQLLRYVPPAHDVLMFILFNTSLSFHKQHLQELLSFYYEALSEKLKQNGFDCSEIITWDEFDKSCKHFFITWKILRIVYMSVLTIDGETFNDILTDMTKYKEMMFINRDQFLLNIYKKNEQYRTRIIEMINDLHEAIYTTRVTISTVFNS